MLLPINHVTTPHYSILAQFTHVCQKLDPYRQLHF